MSCDPLNPAPGCGAGQHCFPTETGIPECGPAGFGTQYALCASATECAPIYACVGIGVEACCLQFCVDDFDCNLAIGETCNFLAPPVSVGPQNYGVCWDGLPCVI